MKSVDERILQAIKEAQVDDSDSEIEASTLHLLGRSFNGMFKLNAIVVISMQLIFAGLTAWSVYNLLNTSVIDLKIDWLVAAIGAFLVFVALRLWLFMELNRLSVLREIKRVELQVSLLINELAKPK